MDAQGSQGTSPLGKTKIPKNFTFSIIKMRDLRINAITQFSKESLYAYILLFFTKFYVCGIRI